MFSRALLTTRIISAGNTSRVVNPLSRDTTSSVNVVVGPGIPVEGKRLGSFFQKVSFVQLGARGAREIATASKTRFPPAKKPFTTSSSLTSNSTAIDRNTTKNKPNTKMPSALTIRPSNERGNADHGWLKTFHTFSFASYFSPSFQSYGPLRVINEDRVSPTTGFGLHGHREFEIFSYVVSGELEHKDSMGNTEILKRGEVQSTSAGTGIRHSEWNRNGEKEVHFLQIWTVPNESKLPPKYYTRHFKDEEKRGKLCKVVSTLKDPEVIDQREGTGPTPVHSDVTMYATILPPSASVTHTFSSSPSTTKGYLHLIQTTGYRDPTLMTEPLKGSSKLLINLGNNGEKVTLEEGDGVFVDLDGEGKDRELTIESIGEKEAEAILFEM